MNGRDHQLLAWSSATTTIEVTPQYYVQVLNSSRSNDVSVNDSHLDENATDYSSDLPYPDFTQIHWVWVTFIVVYTVVIVLSIIGNCLVCVTVYRNKKMHTAVNYYIVNLAICDLFVGAFVTPVKLLELVAPAQWLILSDPLCNFMMYFQTVFVFTSVLTLVATCIERYFAIVHPLESRMNHSKSRAKRILLIVWITPCLVAGPFLYPAKAYLNVLHSDYGTIERLTCFDSFSDIFRQGYFIFLFFFIYLLSLCFITGTCLCIICVLLRDIASFNRQGSLRRQESNRRKVAKMILVVVFSYIFCWTPYFLVSIVTQFQTENFLQNGQFFFSMLCVNLLAFMNSCVNPFIYGLMSVRFRHGFRSIFISVCCCSTTKTITTPNQSAENTGDNAVAVNVVAGRPPVPKDGNRRCSCINNFSSSDSPPTSQEGGGGGNSAVGALAPDSLVTSNTQTQPQQQLEIGCLISQNQSDRFSQLKKLREFWHWCKNDRQELHYQVASQTNEGLCVIESVGKNGNNFSFVHTNVSSVCSSFAALICKTKSRFVTLTFGKSCENHHHENDEVKLGGAKIGPQDTVSIHCQDYDRIANKITEKFQNRASYRMSYSNPNLCSSFAMKSFQFKVYHSTSYHDFDQPAIILEDSVLSNRLMTPEFSRQNSRRYDQTSL